MQNPSVFKLKSGGKLEITGVVIGAIGASICCIGPLLLLALGIGGAWVGSLAAFDAYRPIFSLLTLGFLGFAFYRVYGKPKSEECAPGRYCEQPQSNRINKILLWMVAVVVFGLLSFPYIAPNLAQAGHEAALNPESTQKIVLEVHNMACGGCALTVQKSLAALDGVMSAGATFEPPQAVVMYDAEKVNLKDLIRATTQAGYPSDIQQKNKEYDDDKN